MRYAVIVLVAIAVTKPLTDTPSASVDERIATLQQEHVRILEDRDEVARKRRSAGDLSPQQLVQFQMETLELRSEYGLLNGESKQVIADILVEIDKILELEEFKRHRPVPPPKPGQRTSFIEWTDEEQYKWTANKKRLEIMLLMIDSPGRATR